VVYLRQWSVCFFRWMLCIAAIIVLAGCDRPRISDLNQQHIIQLSDVLNSGDTKNFAKVLDERKFSFPRDHGAHPDYRQEWWYFTGNLEAPDGHRYGYELTLFRIALHPFKQPVSANYTSRTGQAPKPSGLSLWRANQIYMAHFAITDVDNDKFYYDEQFSRDAMRLAGAEVNFSEKITGESTQLKLWLNDWDVESVNSSIFPLRLSANTGEFGISLTLNKTKPIVLQGNNGLSVTGEKPGSASYYYSITRMPTQGEIQIGVNNVSVSGNSWFDHQWFSTQLESEQQGWDWFALQLDDGRDLMFYNIKRKDGSLDLHSAGAIIEQDGQYKFLSASDMNIEVIRQWHSDATNVTYPAGWKILIPRETLELQVTPAIDDQELINTAVRYWEGAVKISGKYKNSNRIVAGKGYVELVGYSPGTK